MTKAKMKMYKVKAEFKPQYPKQSWEGKVAAPIEDPREVLAKAILDNWPEWTEELGEFELHKVWVNGKRYDYYRDFENLFGKNGGSN